MDRSDEFLKWARTDPFLAAALNQPGRPAEDVLAEVALAQAKDRARLLDLLDRFSPFIPLQVTRFVVVDGKYEVAPPPFRKVFHHNPERGPLVTFICDKKEEFYEPSALTAQFTPEDEMPCTDTGLWVSLHSNDPTGAHEEALRLRGKRVRITVEVEE